MQIRPDYQVGRKMDNRRQGAQCALQIKRRREVPRFQTLQDDFAVGSWPHSVERDS